MSKLAMVMAKQAAQDRLLERWRETASKAIVDKLDDARGHARQAITATMRARTQGRRTLAALRRHPSILAAQRRVDELGTGLVDLVRSARDEFARDGVERWREILDPSGPSGKPVSTFAPRAVGLAVMGESLGSYVAWSVRKARASLVVAAEGASDPTRSRRESIDGLDAWHRVESASFATRTALQLRSSLTLIDKLAARSLIPNDLLHPDPFDELGPQA